MKSSKGRSVGIPNYKNDLLTNVIEAVLPNGAALWQVVAKRYQEVSGELNVRDVQDIRRHFTTHKSLCASGKKVTGSSAPNSSVARCQAIWRKILAKSAASNTGARESSDSDSDGSDSGSDRTEEKNQIPNLENESQRPNIDNLFNDDDRPIVPINAPAPPVEVLRPLEQPIIQRRAAQIREPSPVAGHKRKQAIEEERGKSKNCRNHPRSSAGAALSSMAEAYSRKISEPPRNTGDSSVSQMMMMQMMQQNQQFQTQMMMMLMGPRRREHSPPRRFDGYDSRRFNDSFPTSASPSFSSSSSSSSYDHHNRNEAYDRYHSEPSDTSIPDQSMYNPNNFSSSDRF